MKTIYSKKTKENKDEEKKKKNESTLRKYWGILYDGDYPYLMVKK